MALGPGARVGVYEVSALIGEGGMGAVYRATDTNLKRQVALKILPDVFAADPDRLTRFQREAEVLASLNHPHIAAIYGLERSTGSTALVMELVEGEDLSQRIARGAIPIADALPIARQIADALEAAHEQGIIHRDLKPANIKVRADGTVKVLDFGLAKSLDKVPGSRPHAPVDSADSPTVAPVSMTMHGMILGTAAYMSPEQAKGRAVDRRTDVFAFGCVLYEMLTGRRAFDGDDVSDVLGAVVRLEPEWSRLPANTPPTIRHLLRLCLEKSVKNRRGTATDIRLDLERALSEPDTSQLSSSVAPTKSATRLLWPALTAVFLATTAAFAIPYFRGAPAVPRPVMRFEIAGPAAGRFTGLPGMNMAVSPDGTKVAFSAAVEGQPSQLWLRALDGVAPRALPGSALAEGPFWSPDSRFVGFFVPKEELRRVDVASGGSQTLCQCDGRGATWGPNDVVVFGSSNGLQRLPAEGGVPTPVTRLDSSRGETAHVYPRFLPDGRLLFLVLSTQPDTQGLFVTSLDGLRTERVRPAASKAEFAPPDRLLWVHNDTLFTQRFNTETLTLAGEPVRLAEDVPENTTNGRAGFSVSRTGVLVVGERTDRITELTLDWYDRTGRHFANVSKAYPIGMSLSPDGRQLAFHQHDNESGGGDIRITDLDRGTTTRFTFDIAEDALAPVWSPDGRSIAFAARRNEKWGLFRKPADLAGPEELLFESETTKIPTAWAPDGRSIMFVTYGSKSGADMWTLPFSGDRTPVPYSHSPLHETFPSLTRDGRWIAYRRSVQPGPGPGVIYVESYLSPGAKFQPSTERATQPQWRPDGKELFYIDSVSGVLFSVSVDRTGDGLRFGTPQPLFDAQRVSQGHAPSGTNSYQYAVSADGQRFLIPRAPDRSATDRPVLKVILNWLSLLTP